MSTKRRLAVSNSVNEEKPLKQQKLIGFVTIEKSQSDTSLLSKPVDKWSDYAEAESLPLVKSLSCSEWGPALAGEFQKDYFRELQSFLLGEIRAKKTIFPPKHLVFNALNLTPLNQVKVVILGQDPYHGVGQAHGLCFSVPEGVRPPPSLMNIYKELTQDISGFHKPNHGNLEAWSKQGVLLLNATLSVQAHKANSHSKMGWQTFTDAVIQTVSSHCENVVFLLWGRFAQTKAPLIDAERHAILQTAHPSPLSATKFFGCRCFSKTNDALVKAGKSPIDWNLH